MPELGPQTYTGVSAFVGRTADLDPEARASAIRRAVDAATTGGRPAGQIFSGQERFFLPTAVPIIDEERQVLIGVTFVGPDVSVLAV